MDTKLVTDFESAIGAVAEAYFFSGFLSGFIVCALVAGFAVFLSR